MIWSDRTSVNSAWSPENPALGQCAVTALLIQDLFGGELERVVVKNDPHGGSHYFNSVEGIYVDVTASQFTEGADQDGPIEQRSREYVLSSTTTRERYRRLLVATNDVIARRLSELED